MKSWDWFLFPTLDHIILGFLRSAHCRADAVLHFTQ